MTKEEILQAIEGMTVLELSELVKEAKKNPISTLYWHLPATRRSTLSKLFVNLRVSA